MLGRLSEWGRLGRWDADGDRTPTKKHVFKGMPHSFTKYHELESSRRFDELMVESIRWCLDEMRKMDEKGVWRVEGGKVAEEEKE